MTRSTAVATQAERPQGPSLISRVAHRFGVDPDKMLNTLKATAFKGDGKSEVTNEQMMALLVVAEQYQLNPWLKEIYAFPDKRGGIVPVIGIDGWIRIINEHPQFKGMTLSHAEAEDDEIPAWFECSIERKDRDRPTIIREYYSEVKRNTEPWNTMPRRMLRWKAIIQCGRLAFGFGGIYDPEDGEALANAIDVTPARGSKKAGTSAPKALPQSEPAAAHVDQRALVREKLDQSGIPENELLEQFGLESLDAMTFEQAPDVLAWIEKCSA